MGIRTEPSPRRAPLAAIALVEWVRSLPYGRPSDRTAAAMMAERRGTCSTKHLFLDEIFRDRFPELDSKLIHRVHRVDRELAAELYGPEVAAAVPADGVVDVHRYPSIRLAHGRVTVDVTLPGGNRWDGAASWLHANRPQQVRARANPFVLLYSQHRLITRPPAAPSPRCSSAPSGTRRRTPRRV